MEKRKKNRTVNTDICTHCHFCRKNCAFLNRYKIDIGDREQLNKLAYHCFLCGECTRMCPVGIDGRQVILDMRRRQVDENGGKVPKKGYGMLLWEKKDYRFRNYKGMSGKSVLFPGCNFPSFFPETTRYLARLLKEKADMGTIYDCCGKPVAELGLEKKENQIIQDLNERLEKAGVEEVVMVCPNCYHFLKDRLSVKVTGIYKKLRELGLGRQIEGELTMFLPCPDREKQELLSQIRPFLAKPSKLTRQAQCCGLGGCAGVKEPQIAAQMPNLAEYKEEGGQKLCTYCASCCGNLLRKGYGGTEHVLVEILNTKEKASTKKSLINRIKSKYWKEK